MEKSERLAPVVDLPGEAKPQVKTFETLKSEIFAPKCLSCHSGGNETDLTTLTSFQSRLPEIRARLVSTGSGRMPKAGKPQLTSEELKAVLAWIDNGASDVPIKEDPKPSEAMGYYELKEFVLKAKCITCHQGTNPVGDSDDFTTYFGTFAFKGSIKKRILAAAGDPLRMPPLKENGDPIEDRPQLTPEELKAIVDWVDASGPLDASR